MGSIKRYIASYSASYWLSMVTIVFLSLALYISTGISKTPENRMLNVTKTDSEEIKRILFGINEEFNVYHLMFNQMANRMVEDENEREWLKDIENQFAILLEGFFSLHPNVSGYFINIWDKHTPYPLLQTYTDKQKLKGAHISVLMDTSLITGRNGLDAQLRERKEPFYITISNNITETLELLYVAPLYINEEYRGFFGVVINLDSLKLIFDKKITEGSHMTLITENLEILATTTDFPVGSRLEGIDKGAFIPFAKKILSEEGDSGSLKMRYGGEDMMNIFVKLPSGQIFWEAYRLSETRARTNGLIFMLSVSALLCIWMVQKRNGVSPFDKLASRFFEKTSFSGNEEISRKASLGTHIGIIGASLAMFLFTLVNNSSPILKVGAAVTLTAVALFVRRLRKRSFSIQYKYVYLALCLFLPVVFHHVLGGFAAQNGSVLINFCVLTLTLSSFFLDDRRNRGIFALFVVVLFLNAAFEILLIPKTESMVVIRFVMVVFFLGFALFVSTDLYVEGAKNLFDRLNDAYLELQNAQSQLVKEEKMVVLGRLIAGIAHEINTPLGAVKASAEGIDASLESAFEALMKNDMSDEDRALFFRLMELVNESMADMYTTMQIRRAKPKLLSFLTEVGCEDPGLALEKLIRLEICNVDNLEKNRDIFESPNIMKFLNLLIATGAIIKGSYIILQSTEKAYKIIFALKSYSHTNVSSDSILYSITQSIDNVLILLYNQLKNTAEVVRHYDNDIPNMWGKPDELGQVWINLIQNAIHAMGEEGVLTIDIHKENRQVHVVVSDNGTGIAPDVLPHIFEPFYTTKSIGEGSGLGLDICKKIIEGHGGSIEAESEVGVGTVFHVRLPISEKAEE